MSHLRKRLEKLEQNAGVGECLRCSGVFVVRVNGRLHHAMKNDAPIGTDEVEEGLCPECRREPVLIRVPGLGSVPVTGGRR